MGGNCCNSSKYNKTLEEFRRYTDVGLFWFERQGLTLDYVPPNLPLGWFTLNRVPLTTYKPLQRVITVLKKYPNITRSRLQKHCSPYGIKKADLEPMLETLKREGQVLEFPQHRGRRYRWAGTR